MYFEPYGPFTLKSYLDSRSRDWRARFWDQTQRYKGLAGAQGVYVFSLRYADKYTPWYIGMTCSAAGFSQECLQDHKVRIYREVMSEHRGEPVLQLLALCEWNRGNFCRKSSSAEAYAKRVETYLIELGLVQNEELKNDRKTKFVRELEIVGVIGEKYAGRRTNAARALRSSLGLQRRVA